MTTTEPTDRQLLREVLPVLKQAAALNGDFAAEIRRLAGVAETQRAAMAEQGAQLGHAVDVVAILRREYFALVAATLSASERELHDAATASVDRVFAAIVPDPQRLN